MSAEIINTADGVLTVKIAGKLPQSELAALQQRAVELLRGQAKVRILVLAESFDGWEKGGNWGDVSFQVEYDPYIEKMAIVGDKKWEDLLLIFAAKGFRKFPIEYFLPGQTTQARAWLAANP